MPVTPTYPGVYIEEVPSGVRPIAGVATAICAFIGHFRRGPQDRAVQLLSEADFERELGGLDRNSEASYAIRQFFANGGKQAYAVRVLTAGAGDTATVQMQSTVPGAVFDATAGRRVRGTTVEDPGAWGNDVRIDIDYDADDPANGFNLTVTDVALVDDLEVPVRVETYRNLSMDPDSPRSAEQIVNEASKLIQLDRLSGLGDFTRPAQTGTIGADASTATGSDAVNNVGDGAPFLINVNDPGGPVVTGQSAQFTFATPPTSLEQVAAALQTAIRAAGAAMTPAEPLLTGATVEIVGNSLRVRAGRTGTPAVITLAENGATTVADLALSGPGVAANVQQFHLGGAALAFQGAGTPGADPTFPAQAPDATALEGNRASKTGIYALEDVDLFTILSIPRAADLSTGMATVYTAAANYCEERRAFLVIDIPADVDTVSDAKDWLSANGQLRRKNAAAYFPRIRVSDPLNDFRLRDIAASGTIAGLYARTDSNRGVWKAPAGIEASLRNVSDLAAKLTDPENGQLNPEGLNSLRHFDTFGPVAWGARTLVGADRQASEWKYVPVRRLALFLEESLYRGTQWVVFEPNDEPLWAQIRLNVGAFMQNLFRQGAFQGATPKDAYLVKCDHETTTQADIDLGIVNIVVGFAPLKPAEFVILKIQQLAGQTQS